MNLSPEERTSAGTIRKSFEYPQMSAAHGAPVALTCCSLILPRCKPFEGFECPMPHVINHASLLSSLFPNASR